MNYDLEMERQISALDGKKRLLLHVCCAPCSTAVLERLAGVFKITLYFYNPNIDAAIEYQKRIDELKKFLKLADYNDIDIIEGNYEPEKFEDISLGLENEPERGRRCYKCYNLRLEETARVALAKDFDFFTTTLSLSPHKNSNWINEIGSNLSRNYNVEFLYSDFKKKDGYKRSIELSKQYDLYRQDYCGCIYSKKS